LPASHSTQEEAAALEIVPAGHSSHEAEANVLNLPASQNRHSSHPEEHSEEVVVENENWPAGQGVQVSVPPPEDMEPP
jgi:hypothetical protein